MLQEVIQNIQLYNNGSDEAVVLKTICEAKQLQSHILSQITEDIFQLGVAREIYARMQTYLQNGKTIPSVAVWRNDNALSDAARALFSNTEGALFDKDDIDPLIEKLRESKNRKLLVDTLIGLLNDFNKYKNVIPILTILDDVIAKCRDVKGDDEFKHYESKNQKNLVDTAEKQMSEDIAKVSIPTGFTEFDTKTGGLFRKNTMVVASVPGGGKSAMALQMGLHQYSKGFNVCLVTYEMDIPELDNRIYSNVSKVNHSEINLKRIDSKKKKLVLERYGDWLQSSKKGNRYSIWAPQKELTIPQIAMELKGKGYDVVYIDYLSLLYNNPKKAMWENLGEHTRAAKLAANQLDCVFVLLAQLDDETNKIKYAKSIAANANFIWTWEFGDKERESGIIEVKQKKARNAGIYPFYLEVDYSIFSFKDYMGPTLMHDAPAQTDTVKRKGKKPDSDSLAAQPPPMPDKRGIPKMPALL
jgi:replicative DNA helicase